MKLILQFIKPHRWLCAAAVLLLIIDVTGSLIVSTPDFGTDAALRRVRCGHKSGRVKTA